MQNVPSLIPITRLTHPPTLLPSRTLSWPRRFYLILTKSPGRQAWKDEAMGSRTPLGLGLAWICTCLVHKRNPGLPLHSHTGSRGAGHLDWAARFPSDVLISRQGPGGETLYPSPAHPGDEQATTPNPKAKIKTGNNFPLVSTAELPAPEDSG